MRKVQKGDVVTVFGEGEKRCKWKLAVVEELIVGKDKEVRGAKVRVVGKGKPFCLNRPIRNFSHWKFKLDRVGKGRKGVCQQLSQRETCMNDQDGRLL